MGESAYSSNNINSNLISRNTPVGLIVGAAGFLGSHLVEELLKKHLQVIGVDDFSSGSRENLSEAVKDKNFHLLNISASEIRIDLPRLDYLFIVAEGGWQIENLLHLAEKHKSKICFVSSIELYGRELAPKLQWFKHNESKVAKVATEYKLNARVIRLGPIFGPRMHFRTADPAIRLIQAAIKGEIQKELAALEFSSRAMYIKDAINLIIKSVFSGSTALKIYDGATLSPIKVSEIRQILLDPLWHEQKGFTPSELPPWPTPNLLKTMKELSWAPKEPLLSAVKETLSSFKGKVDEVPEPVVDKSKWQAQPLKLKYKSFEIEKEPEQDEYPKKVLTDRPKRQLKFLSKSAAFILIGWLVVILGIIYPIGSIGFGVLAFKYNLDSAARNLEKGEVEKSLANVQGAKRGVEGAGSVLKSLEILSRVKYLDNFYQKLESGVVASGKIADAAEETVIGSQKVFQALKIISGEKEGDIKSLLSESESELSAADTQLSLATLQFKGATENVWLPGFLSDKVETIQDRLALYDNLIKSSRAAAQILPKIIALEGKKSYLLLLQNNGELRPTGGFIGTIARIDFEGGKLKKLDVQDVYEIDGHLTIHVEPPKEIKEDLGQKDWYLRDSNFEPDFPTSARQAMWFYNKESGSNVDGVIAMDVNMMENLLSVTGPIKLTDYNEEITADNLFERAVTHSEQGFFPGSQAKKNFLTALSTEVLNEIFFSQKQNWPGLISSVGKSFSGKHLLVYLADPKLFSYLVSNNWAGTMPRPTELQDGVVNDFLSLVEANFGANKSNYYLDRSLNLETTIGKEGEILHKLRVAYTNRSPSDVWPAGKYKNRMRIYLPLGAKLTRLSWGEDDITDSAQAFVDFGRTGYSILLELEPKEQKTLTATWTLPSKVEFASGKALYRMDIIKQAGTLKDPLTWKLTYPINYRLSTSAAGTANPQEYDISTDLSTDRSFEVSFSK